MTLVVGQAKYEDETENSLIYIRIAWLFGGKHKIGVTDHFGCA